MPMTAFSDRLGVLDLTHELAPFDAVYRQRPRAVLQCRECGHGLHAKVSTTGLRFFAHDPNSPSCSLAGESAAHHLLKLVLASAIRGAGWHAGLEVPGDQWRVDVMATSPDGERRMAWEAQLASTTSTDLQERTDRMRSSGVEVCWVTDRDVPWMGTVPSVRIDADANFVRDGLGAFADDWCSSGGRCRHPEDVGLAALNYPKVPCPGHGRWYRPADVALAVLVAGVLEGTVGLHRVRTSGLTAFGRHWPGPLVWTTRGHVIAEQAQVDALGRAREALDGLDRERRRHDQARAELRGRQQAITPAAVEETARVARGYVGVRDPSPDWAMGVPLFVHDVAEGVVCPVASRVTPSIAARLGGVIVFVASEVELRRLARVLGPTQRFFLVEPR